MPPLLLYRCSVVVVLARLIANRSLSPLDDEASSSAECEWSTLLHDSSLAENTELGTVDRAAFVDDTVAFLALNIFLADMVFRYEMLFSVGRKWRRKPILRRGDIASSGSSELLETWLLWW